MPMRPAPRAIESILALLVALLAPCVAAPTAQAELFEYAFEGEFDDAVGDPLGIEGAHFTAQWVVDSNDMQSASTSASFVQTVYGTTSATITITGSAGGAQDGVYVAALGRATLVSQDDPTRSDRTSLTLDFLTAPPEQHPAHFIATVEFLGNEYFDGWPLELPPFQPLRVIFYRADMDVSGFDQGYHGLNVPEPERSTSAIASLLAVALLGKAASQMRARNS